MIREEPIPAPSPGALVALHPAAGWDDVKVMLVIAAPIELGGPPAARQQHRRPHLRAEGRRTLRDFMGRPYVWVMHPTLGPTQIPQGHVAGVVQGRVV